MTINHDISEEFQYNLSKAGVDDSFEITDIDYDIIIDDLPFIVSVNNQNPYRRETAQYRKDQFDNSQEPGEQSLTGWWLRSQTSWHNGAGIKYYEPGTDYANVNNRFDDSRGIDIWTIGEIKLLNDIYHNYTGANGIVADTGKFGIYDYIISGDSAGVLKSIRLDGDTPASTIITHTLKTGHNSTNYFKSITTDGTRYFAVCTEAIHVGNIDGSVADKTIARHVTTGTHTIKYTKGYLMFGEAWKLYYIPLANPLIDINHDGSENFPSGTLYKQHENPSFIWNSIEGGNRVIYASGYAGSDCEVWAVPFDETSLTPNPAAAIQVVQLPYGEIVNAMSFYLGYLILATNKGLRVCQTQTDGSVTLGPLLFESDYGFTGLVPNSNYVWASTTVDEGELKNACLVRVDLSAPFDDGSFAYAYDLQYLSDENSYGTGVLFADNRLHIITNEGAEAGEIQTENLSVKRPNGWLTTGGIRYGTIEPKFFRYINVQCSTGQGDTIDVYTINKKGLEVNIATLSEGVSNQDLLIKNPVTRQEFIAFKFVFNNVTEDQGVPILNAYQIKATPATRRQRLYQYPLSCYDTEMDKFNSVFGYKGRAMELIKRLEAIEESGRFVNIIDYRTGEEYQGTIEEVRFTNETSPDKDSSGFGGLLLVTVRKM